MLKKIVWGLVILWVLVPFVPLFFWAFAENWWFPSVLPESFSFRAWSYLLRPGGRSFQALMNSVGIALLSTLCSFALGVPAARYIGSMHRARTEYYRVAFSLPLIVPPLAIAFGLHILFIRLSLAGTFLGVVISHVSVSLPYTLYILTGIFTRVHPDYEQQARSLGAGPWRLFFSVSVRLAVKGILVAGVVSFLVSWHQYLLTLIIGGGRINTLPTLLFSFVGSGDLTLIGATAVLFFLPPLLLFMAASFLLGEQE